jgi:oxygen-dependent protoporphyrinogen oxidase
MRRAGSVDVAVVGAGITGLTAAFRLARAGRSVVVLEASGRVGGAISSVREAGFLFELGPAFLPASARAADLIAAAGLRSRRLEAGPMSRLRQVWVRGRLLEVPSNPLDLLTSSLLSAGAKLRLLREPWASPPPDREESVAEFARRRLGDEAARLALSPLVAGLWAGDPETLSARHAFPELWEMERRHGSLLSALRQRRAEPSPRSAGWSLRGGLEALPKALAGALDVRLGTECRAVSRAGHGWRVESAAGAWRAPDVVLACSAGAAAAVLDGASGGLSRALSEIAYAPMAVVGLGVRREDVARRLDAAGFLAPREPGLRLLGCLYLSTLFPGHAPAGCAALIAVLGGATDPGAARWSAARLVEAAVEDLGKTLGLRGRPLAAVTRKLPHALPQYAVGHGRFLDLARRLEEDLAGIHLAGSYRGGISLGDCLARGEAVASRIAGASTPAW